VTETISKELQVSRSMNICFYLVGYLCVQSISSFVTNKHADASTQAQIMTTYEKHLYGVTGGTQGADAPLMRAYSCIENISKIRV